MMTLLLQLNGDLPERFPSHERRLYIFACRSKTCKKKAGSIRTIRGIRTSDIKPAQQEPVCSGTSQQNETKQSQPPPMLGDRIFGSKSPPTTSSNMNPFSSTPSTSSSASNPFANPNTNPFSDLASKPPQRPDDGSSLPTTFAQKVRLSYSPPSLTSAQGPRPIPHEPWPEQSQLPPPYPSYHLDADYETLDNVPSDQPTSRNIDIDDESGGGGGGGGGGGSKDEPYESSLDKTFQGFATRLSHNPLQVLRYEFGGSPLLYSRSDVVGKLFNSSSGGGKIPRCGNCGAKRVFELQLVPQAIAELEVEEVGLEGMEWGTVIVGVCGDDCAAKGVEGGVWGWVEEWVGVQWEETGGGGGVGVGGRK